MDIDLGRLEESVLPLVTKPNRYLSPISRAGRPEYEDAEARLCLLVPAPVERALSRPGTASVVDALETAGGRERTHVDTAFLPAEDLEAALREHGLPLFGLAARRALREYPVILAVPGGVLELPDLAAMLELGGLPLRAADRGPEAPLVVLAGPVSLTPGAVLPFVDAVAVGDPEAFAADLVEAARAGGREAARGRLAGLPGVMLSDPGARPAPADPQFTAPGPVGARWLESLPPVPLGIFDPLIETEAGGVAVELVRPRGVEDSASEPAPLRVRSLERTLRETEAAVAASGQGEILLTPDSADRHPDLVPLLEAMNQRFGAHAVQLRLGEVDPDRLVPPLARELCKGRRTRLDFGVLAPSARLREETGRPLGRDALIEAAGTALRGGWSAVRFRVLVGLPGETRADREEWVETVEAVRDLRIRGGSSPRIGLEAVPFVPRPHTPLASAPVPDPGAVAETVEGWRARLARRKVKVGLRDPWAAAAEAALLRGAPGSAEVVEAVARSGARRQTDPDAFAARRWEEILTRHGLDPASAADGTAPPWYPILDDPPVPSGRGGSTTERRSHAPGTSGEAAVPPGFGAPAWMVGRRPRRAARGREARQAERYRLRFSKDEPARFSAHLDVTRSLERAFRKAQLPLAMTQGKDRRPKLSFGPPLPLGMTSEAEYLDVVFAREVPESFVNSLNEALPDGLRVTAQAPIRNEPDSLNSAIQIADYDVSFSDTLIRSALGGPSFETLAARLQAGLDRARSARTLEVTKVRGEESRTFNARPSLIRGAVARDDGGRPYLTLRLTLNRPDSVRPELLTSVLCDWADFDERLLRVHRSGLHIPGRNDVLDPLDVVASGFAWWRQTVRGGAVS